MPGANCRRKSETRRNNVMQKLFMYMYLPTTKPTVPLGLELRLVNSNRLIRFGKRWENWRNSCVGLLRSSPSLPT